MAYIDKIQNVSVLGAAGKMGSGILLLTAIEMIDNNLLPENRDKQFVLNAIDVSHQALSGVMRYLRNQIQKAAEKKVVWLRQMYSNRTDLIENSQIINEYVFDALNIVRPSINLEATYQSAVIFEAIKEDPELKVNIFKKINKNNPNKPWFLTNTSSIPINRLNTDAELNGQIIGFHFYNPPAIQKLVEIIKAKETLPELSDFSMQYAKNLRKVIVPSNDFAGFIGNGHFMRDALYGITEAEKLAENMPLHEAVLVINKISQEFLVRPMGIFQLIDYVGIDVCQYIMGVMNPYLENEELHSKLLDKLLLLNVKGGQNADGSQKNGFLRYEKGKTTGVYNFNTNNYEDITAIINKLDEFTGALPTSFVTWKSVASNPSKNELLTLFFSDLVKQNTKGAELAKNYMNRSREIGKKLVADKVANSPEDVNTVLLTGFFHAYGPINEFLK